MDEISKELVGKVILLKKGTYSGTTTYSALDVIRYSGREFVALRSTKGNTPPSMNSSASNSYWQLLAGAGSYVPSVSSSGILI